MASTKISALNALTTPHSTDELAIVDKTDTSQASSGTTKKITRANLITGLAASGANSDITSITALSTPLSVAQGGTASATAANARTALGLAIGTNVQAWDADLDTLAGKTIPSGATLADTSSSQTFSTKSIDTANGNTLSVAGQSLAGTYTTWTPTLAASAGTYTTTTIRFARYIQIGKMVRLELNVFGTTSTTPTFLTFTLPVNAKNIASSTYDGGRGSGSGYSSSGTNFNGIVTGVFQSATTVGIIKYDGSNWASGAGNGFSYFVEYEAA